MHNFKFRLGFCVRNVVCKHHMWVFFSHHFSFKLIIWPRFFHHFYSSFWFVSHLLIATLKLVSKAIKVTYSLFVWLQIDKKCSMSLYMLFTRLTSSFWNQWFRQFSLNFSYSVVKKNIESIQRWLKGKGIFKIKVCKFEVNVNLLKYTIKSARFSHA